MNTDIKYYLKIYNNWIEDTVCDTTVNELENISWKQHTFYNSLTDNYHNISGDKELDISLDHVSTQPYIMQRVWDGYQQYLSDLNFTWFRSWTGFSKVRFNRYVEDRVMAEHCDHIHSMFDGERKGIPTMTALGFLNDQYVGGELVMWQTETIKVKKGDLLIFPSCFLYPHRVEPVKSGVRYSFVSWAW
jgi:hypothetical protein